MFNISSQCERVYSFDKTSYKNIQIQISGKFYFDSMPIQGIYNNFTKNKGFLENNTTFSRSCFPPFNCLKNDPLASSYGLINGIQGWGICNYSLNAGLTNRIGPGWERQGLHEQT